MTWNLLQLARMLKDAGGFLPLAINGRNGTRERASNFRIPNIDHDSWCPAPPRFLTGSR